MQVEHFLALIRLLLIIGHSLLSQTETSDPLRTFSKYIPAKPDKKHANKTDSNPKIEFCATSLDFDSLR